MGWFMSARGDIRVRAERQHRRLAVELHHRLLCVYLARRGEWGGLCRLADGNVYALNASTGAKLWSYADRLGCIPRPRWRMGWFMSARGDNNVYALNAKTGAKLWSYTTGNR